MTIPKFGNKIRSLHIYKTNYMQLDSFVHILLWCSIINHCLHGAFPNMELMLLLSPLFLIDLLYFPSRSIKLFLTGCLCAPNYMSKLDHLIYLVVPTLVYLQAWKFSAFPRISAFFPILEFFPRFFIFNFFNLYHRHYGNAEHRTVCANFIKG